ncbi:hypothetical protein GCM10007884_27040 [Methylobacterium brachythecii]|uniref:Uncharacterized protein n=1 Tax=Methylobacterium brachythecii TaxID=1176177 RepID=A0ABQ6D3S7_9HYPH|nr:hypothetical protein GCM10007884_27040 [Methylobacterium brachythecii]
MRVTGEMDVMSAGVEARMPAPCFGRCSQRQRAEHQAEDDHSGPSDNVHVRSLSLVVASAVENEAEGGQITTSFVRRDKAT